MSQLAVLSLFAALDFIDQAAILIYLVLAFGLPIMGYWLMVIDIRAYLRALKGALMIVKNHIPGLPAWAKQHTPGSLRSLGLDMPCTEDEVKRAYRKLADSMHPDRGGDRRKFLILQSQFEEAIEWVREVNQRGRLPQGENEP